MGENFGKVEKISFRISESVDSDENRCSQWISTQYHDERFFGIWTNNSNEINDSCADLFRYYTFLFKWSNFNCTSTRISIAGKS